MKKFRLAYLFLFIASLFACNSENINKEANTYEITDAAGRIVSIPNSIESIIALRSGALRMLAYLDACDRVIAVEANEHRRNVPYLYANPQLRNLPVIGTGNIVEPELISAHQPDVIFMTYTTAAEADELQNKTGCTVVVLNYGDFNQNITEFYKTLKFLGEILDKEARADSLSRYIKASIKNLEERTKDLNTSESVYIGGIAYRGSHGITSTEPMYAAFRFVNANNVAKDLGEVTSSPKAWLENAFIDKEKLLEWNPDHIFIDASGLDLAVKDLENENYKDLLRASNKDKLYIVLPHNWYTTNYENIICNAWYIGKVLYPEKFDDVHIDRKASEIYTAFLGVDVSDSVMNQYNAFRKYE